jgi:hypothetical protein
MSDSVRAKAAAVLRQSRARKSLEESAFGSWGDGVKVNTMTVTIDEITKKKFYDDQAKTRELLNSTPSVETLKENS